MLKFDCAHYEFMKKNFLKSWDRDNKILEKLCNTKLVERLTTNYVN